MALEPEGVTADAADGADASVRTGSDRCRFVPVEWQLAPASGFLSRASAVVRAGHPEGEASRRWAKRPIRDGTPVCFREFSGCRRLWRVVEASDHPIRQHLVDGLDDLLDLHFPSVGFGRRGSRPGFSDSSDSLATGVSSTVVEFAGHTWPWTVITPTEGVSPWFTLSSRLLPPYLDAVESPGSPGIICPPYFVGPPGTDGSGAGPFSCVPLRSLERFPQVQIQTGRPTQQRVEGRIPLPPFQQADGRLIEIRSLGQLPGGQAEFLAPGLQNADQPQRHALQLGLVHWCR